MFIRVFFTALILFLPTTTLAAVFITEVAWMGTETDSNNEWIEIYNFSNTPTDITGWSLTDGNSLNIDLSGTMPPHGVFLLERTDDTTVPDFPASIIYTGALVNSGATLTIIDAEGTTIGELVGGEDWVNIGGNNELKYTAQQTMTGTWVTGVPTPGMPNIEEDAEIPEEETDNTPQTSSETPTGTGGNTSISLTLPDTELSLVIEAPNIAYVNQSIDLAVNASGIGSSLIDSLYYTWNFGDSDSAVGSETSHKYQYPGEYVIVTEAGYARHKTIVRHHITVLPVTLSLARATDGAVLIHNDAKYDVDVSGYRLVGSKSLEFPQHSIILPNGTITIPAKKIENGVESMLALYDEVGVIMATEASAVLAYKPPTKPTTYTKSTSYTPTPTITPTITPASEVDSSDKEVITITPKAGTQAAVAIESLPASVPKNQLLLFALIGFLILLTLAVYTRRI